MKTKEQIVDPLKEQIFEAAMDFVRAMSVDALGEIHGHKSIDYVLGYQKCAKDIIAAAGLAKEAA